MLPPGKPLTSMPEVPSLKQLGQPVQFAQWSALFVPAGTPEAIVQKLRAAAKKAAADPQVVATISRAGSPIEYLDAPEFQTYWDADAAEMTKAVRAVGKVEYTVGQALAMSSAARTRARPTSSMPRPCSVSQVVSK